MRSWILFISRSAESVWWSKPTRCKNPWTSNSERRRRIRIPSRRASARARGYEMMISPTYEPSTFGNLAGPSGNDKTFVARFFPRYLRFSVRTAAELRNATDTAAFRYRGRIFAIDEKTALTASRRTGNLPRTCISTLMALMLPSCVPRYLRCLCWSLSSCWYLWWYSYLYLCWSCCC